MAAEASGQRPKSRTKPKRRWRLSNSLSVTPSANREFYHQTNGQVGEGESVLGSDVAGLDQSDVAAAGAGSAGVQLRTTTRDDDETDTTEDEPPVSQCDGEYHVGRHVTSLELPLHVDQVFTLLFTHSDFGEALNRERKYYDVVADEWQDSEAGRKVRTIRFQMDVNHPLGKTTTVTEEQTMLPVSQPGCLYAVNSEVNNAGVPMADVFYVTKHYCLNKVSSNKTRLDIWCQTKFRKSTLFKSFIEKTSNDGMDEHHAVLNQMLLETVGDTVKNKRGRRRRAGSKGGGADNDQTGTEPTALSPRSVKGGSGGSELRAHGSDSLLLLVLFFMLALLAMNGYLYYRMSRLSDQTESFANRELLLAQFKTRPQRSEDWLKLLQRQDELHRAELHKWQLIVQSVTQLLQQTETALGTLQGTLESYRVRDSWTTLLSAPPEEPAPGQVRSHGCSADLPCPADTS